MGDFIKRKILSKHYEAIDLHELKIITKPHDIHGYQFDIITVYSTPQYSNMIIDQVPWRLIENGIFIKDINDLDKEIKKRLG